MSMKNHYKEKFWDYSNDELKDIVAGRFGEASDEEIAAAIELLKERRSNTASSLSLGEIPNASMPVLIEIVKNPDNWGEEAVAIAEREMLRREQGGGKPQKTSTADTILKAILGIFGIFATVVLIKVAIALVFMCFLFYTAISCLNDL